MKKNIMLLIILLSVSTLKSYGHFLWLETNNTGSINQKQEVKIYFGEYSGGVYEKVGEEAFEKMKSFSLWVVAPDGEKTELKASPKELYYLAEFVPKQKGTYTVILDNNNIDVMDYTKYDFGIFKPHYHAIAKVEVEEKPSQVSSQNPDGLTIIDVSKKAHQQEGEVTLKVLFKGEPLAKNEFTVFVSDLWAKKLETNENGEVTFKLPWKMKYVMEATYSEKVPGKFNGKDYEFIWHCATYSINLN